MRDYGVVSPKFWIGETGKLLRGDPEAQVLALYLITSPHSNMTGIFHCPILYMSHETGIPIEGAGKALARLIEAGFCRYESATETVFVVRMAAFQIGEGLKAGDKRVIGLRKEVARMPNSPLKSMFLNIYGEKFQLADLAKNDSPCEAPSEPHRSQDQDQDQEQEKDIPPVPSKRSGPIEIKTFLENCKLNTEKPIPENDPVFAYAEETGIPHEFLRLAWREFVERSSDSGKRYRDWRKAFRNCIRGNWYKLWWCRPDGDYELTTTGVQAQRKHSGAAA